MLRYNFLPHGGSFLFGFLFVFVFSIPVFAQSDIALAQAHFLERGELAGLTEADLNDLILTSQTTSAHNGVTHQYFRQSYQGIGIYRAVGDLHLDKNDQPFSSHNSFLSRISSRVQTTQPALSAEQAIQAAVTHLGLGTIGTLPVLEAADGPDLAARLSGGSVSLEPIPVRLMYYQEDNGALTLCWDLAIAVMSGDHWWNFKINASTGAVLDQYDWVTECHFDAPPAENGALPHAFAAPAMPAPAPPPAPNTYRVYDMPVESPNHGGRTSVANPGSPTASPFGWHDTNGANGAEFTITRGNNVHAQEDANGNNGTGYSPDGGPTLDFEFPINLAQDPVNYRDAALTNLFYWNNLIHDVWYRYGFDEASGNFQQNNYGRGGTGGDYVQADGQDGSGINNANFGTPTDGNRPRMQMFLWAGQASVIFDVNSPPVIAGGYNAVEAGFGPGLPTTPLTGDLVLVDDASANPTEGCNALVNGGAVNGNIALVDRGNCTFVSKVQNAQNAGAVACVVCNNVAGAPIVMGGTSGTINIPSVMISQSDCALLKAQLAGGVNITMYNTGPVPDRDGDLDNGIIAHEYGHGISNRLTGGRNNTNCLGNSEQMGEGWSDFIGLAMTMEPGDLGGDIRGIGTYAIFQPTSGGGIRPAPYTTDMNVNPFTYGDISNTGTISQPHGIGFLWSNMLWEMTWMLVDRYGFDPDIENGNGGNNIAMQLVIDGMKLQPCSPGFVDGRDAILQADQINYGGANQCLIWSAFAKRGLGFSASQGSASNRSDGSEAFDLPPGCNFFPVEWLEFTATAAGNHIALDWKLAQETGNEGFVVQRRVFGEGEFEQIGYVASFGDTQKEINYTFNDENATPGITYEYRLKQIDANGGHEFSSVAAARLPLDYMVSLYPNPSNGAFTLQWAGREQVDPVVRVFDMMGREVPFVVEGKEAFRQQLQLDVVPGVYLVRVRLGGTELVRKMRIE